MDDDRTLLQVGCGHSLRETAVRARRVGLAGLSDVELIKRPRKSKAWPGNGKRP